MFSAQSLAMLAALLAGASLFFSLWKRRRNPGSAKRDYELFLEGLPDAALLFDRDGTCVAANAAARRRLEIRDAQDLTLRDLFLEEDAYRSFCFDGDAAPRRLETGLRTLRGKIFSARLSGGVRRDGPDRGMGYFLSIEDITDHRLLEAERI